MLKQVLCDTKTLQADLLEISLLETLILCRKGTYYVRWNFGFPQTLKFCVKCHDNWFVFEFMGFQFERKAQIDAGVSQKFELLLNFTNGFHKVVVCHVEIRFALIFTVFVCYFCQRASRHTLWKSLVGCFTWVLRVCGIKKWTSLLLVL